MAEDRYVLVVDDDPHTRTLVTDALTVLGVSSRQARNGQQALEMIRADAPRAIVLDLMMPVLNGFAVLAELQRAAGEPIPVIVLSALVDQAGPLHHLPGVAGVMCKGDFSLEGLRGLLAQAGISG